MKRKILFAYDGSDYADRALQDLNNLGFAHDSVEIEVITAADVFVVPFDDEKAERPQLAIVSKLQDRTKEKAIDACTEAEYHAAAAAAMIRKQFPHWKVTTYVTEEPPTWGILNRIDSWKPQLVILGSHGRTGIERVLLGSVSQRVLGEASCSVRIVKGRRRPKEKVLICIDHSSFSLEAVREVTSRMWPVNTEFKLFSTIERPFITTLIETSFTLAHLYSAVEEELVNESLAIEKQYCALFLKSQKVSIEVCRGNPKRMIIAEAEEWGATTIFLGSKGITDLEKGRLGSVTSTITAHAPCTVEVVRKEHPIVQESQKGRKIAKVKK